MSSPREKVDALVRLATSAKTPVEEARTAAMLALRLIVEHKMLDRGSAPPASPKSARPGPRPSGYSWTVYVVDDPIPETYYGKAEDLEKLTDFMKRMNERIDSQRRKAQDEEKTKGWK